MKTLRNCWRRWLCLCGTLLTLQTAPAQDFLGSSDSTKRIRILPAPTITKDPETGLAFGGIALIQARFYDKDVRPANGKVEVQLTTEGQLITQVEWLQFSAGEHWLIEANMSLLHFPENVYAIGPRAGETSAERYESWRFEVSGRVAHQVVRNLFVGPVLQYQSMWDIQPANGGLLDNDLLPGSQGGHSVGLGAGLVWDSRQNQLNPQQGVYLLAQSHHFRRLWGSDYIFSQYELDARRYWTTHTVRLADDRKAVLAVQARFVGQTPQAPFRMLPLLGSNRDMRGYYRGRFRDRNYYAIQAEHRLPIYGRFGIVTFVGAGDVAPNVGEFSLSTLKPTYGTGVRFLVDRKRDANVRVDFAWGQSTSGVYISFGEAF